MQPGAQPGIAHWFATGEDKMGISEGLERETTTENVLLLSNLLAIVANLKVNEPGMNLGIPRNHTMRKSLPAFYHYDHEGTPHPRSQGQESGTGRIPPR